MPKIPKGFNARAKPYIKAFFTLPQITQINTDFCYSGTSVNICGVYGRTFICCLKGNIPQITRINTDFSFLKNICEYLWNLWENIHMQLER